MTSSTHIYAHARTQAEARAVTLILGEGDSFLTYKETVFVLQIPWPASPTRRDECKWAGKDLSVRAKTIHLASGCQHFAPAHSHRCLESVFVLLHYEKCATLQVLNKTHLHWDFMRYMLHICSKDNMRVSFFKPSGLLTYSMSHLDNTPPSLP